MKFYKIQSIEPAVSYLHEIIDKHLEQGGKVLWLVTGGSAIKVAADVSKKISSSKNLARLFVTLTDETAFRRRFYFT
jgi:pantothenate kinase